jgi:hypothetical protein
MLVMSWACRARQIVDLVHLYIKRLSHIMPDKFKVVIIHQMPDVIFTSCKKVVNADNVVALIKKFFT